MYCDARQQPTVGSYLPAAQLSSFYDDDDDGDDDNQYDDNNRYDDDNNDDHHDDDHDENHGNSQRWADICLQPCYLHSILMMMMMMMMMKTITVYDDVNSDDDHDDIYGDIQCIGIAVMEEQYDFSAANLGAVREEAISLHTLQFQTGQSITKKSPLINTGNIQ